MLKQVALLAILTLTSLHSTFAMNLTHALEEEIANKRLMRIYETRSGQPRDFDQEIERLLNEGANANYARALHNAAKKGHEFGCRLLLERGANVNAQDKYRSGITPLMEGIKHLRVCKLLIAYGAHVNILDYNGYIALSHAIAGGSSKVCELLMENGAYLLLDSPYSPLLDLTRSYANLHQTEDCKVILAIGIHTTCTAIMNTQKRFNNTIITTLLCLNRLRKTETHGVLYREFKRFLLPHMNRYIPLKHVLNIRDFYGKRAYDYLKIACLDPDNIDSDYLKSNTAAQATAQNAITEQVDQSWFSNCSVQ
jgi:ankyrin repeat protein